MDRVTRLIFGLVLFALSHSVWAINAVPAVNAVVYNCSGSLGSSALAACKLNYQKDTATTDGSGRTYHYVVDSCSAQGSDPLSQWKCVTYYFWSDKTTSSSKSYGILLANASMQASCPDNSTSVGGGQCSCNTNYMPNTAGNACNQYTCPVSGEYSAVTQPDQKVANAGDKMCSGGCGYTPSSWKVGADGQIWATWPFKSTGSFCNGAASSTNAAVSTGEQNSQSPAPVKCGANQCPGTVNGATICVPCAKTTEAASTSSSSASGPSASASSASTTTTQNSCDGTTCTKTTITTDGSGGTTTTTTTQSQGTFCTENPSSPLCQQSSFGGTCAATTCSGDAVQCAIAADQYRRNCQWFDDPKIAPLQATGEAAMTGELQPAGHPANSAANQSISFSSTIDQTDRLASGCPVDVPFTVNGVQWNLPFASMCDKLRLVGNAMVGVFMLIAVLIVFRN